MTSKFYNEMLPPHSFLITHSPYSPFLLFPIQSSSFPFPSPLFHLFLLSSILLSPLHFPFPSRSPTYDDLKPYNDTLSSLFLLITHSPHSPSFLHPPLHTFSLPFSLPSPFPLPYFFVSSFPPLLNPFSLPGPQHTMTSKFYNEMFAFDMERKR